MPGERFAHVHLAQGRIESAAGKGDEVMGISTSA
jgi:hypothetical protein